MNNKMERERERGEKPTSHERDKINDFKCVDKAKQKEKMSSSPNSMCERNILLSSIIYFSRLFQCVGLVFFILLKQRIDFI